jgi:GDP-L-fucose synthase
LADAPGVSGTSLWRSRRPQNEQKHFQSVEADLSTLETARRAIGEADFLLMFAGVVAPSHVIARDPVAPAIANLRLIANALEAAWLAGVKKVVWLSSTTVYPDIDGVIDEAMATQGEPPGNWYAIGSAMRTGEMLCRAYSSHPARPMPCIVLRPTLVYGDHDSFGDDAHFVPALLRRVAERQDPIEIWGDGEQRRDVVHADDVVNAALLALNRISSFDTFNVGSGESVSVNHVLSRLLALDAYGSARIVHKDTSSSTPRLRSFSIEKARRLLGYAPQISLDEGLRRTLAWFRQRASG